jgi:hypothetical protein
MKCQHSGCSCDAQPGSAYCSVSCSLQDPSASGTCQCGHLACLEGDVAAEIA